MSYIETRINDGEIVFETAGGPGFNTNVVVTHSGREKRNANWSQARGRWELGERVMHQTELDAIVKFFRATQGRALGFRFKDFADFSATIANGRLGTGVGDGGTTYQLKRRYTQASQNIDRDIKKPVTGTVKVFVDAVEQLSGYTLDTVTGIVTFSSSKSAAQVLTWSGEFDVPVRFDTDEIKTRFDAYDKASLQAFHYLFSLPIVELRP